MGEVLLLRYCWIMATVHQLHPQNHDKQTKGCLLASLSVLQPALTQQTRPQFLQSIAEMAATRLPYKCSTLHLLGAQVPGLYLRQLPLE